MALSRCSLQICWLHENDLVILSQLQVQHEFEWQDCESLTRDFKLLGRAGGSPGHRVACRSAALRLGP